MGKDKSKAGWRKLKTIEKIREARKFLKEKRIKGKTRLKHKQEKIKRWWHVRKGKEKKSRG